MSDKDENERAILRLDESMSLDEPEGAAAQTEPPESPEVRDMVTPGSQDKEVQSESSPLAQGQEVNLTHHVDTPDQSEEGLLNTMVHGDTENSSGDVRFLNVKC